MAKPANLQQLSAMWAFVLCNPGCRQTQIAAAHQLPRDVVYRSLPQLEQHGFLLFENNNRLYPYKNISFKGECKVNVTKETVKNIIRALAEIVHGATIATSRHKYDFYADRLRVACTSRGLLATINAYSELLGSPVLTSATTKGVMLAAASDDADAVYQWLREQPKMAIAMTALKKDELSLTIDAFVGSYDSVVAKADNIKKRTGFEIEMRAVVEQALSHGDDKKAGNSTLFRRGKVRGGAELPYYSANAIGGQLRDLLADHFLTSLGFKLSQSNPVVERWFYHTLYSGGIMGDGAIPKAFERALSGAASGTIDVDGVSQLRNMIPFFSLLGGVGKYPLTGRVYINDLRPECIEWGNGDESVHGMMDWRYIARRDDSEGRVSKAQITEDATLANAANTSMLVNVECLTEGVVLEGGIDISKHATDIEMAALSRGLLLLQEQGALGGKVRRGFGRVAIEYKTKLQLDPTPYDNYLAEHKSEIIEYLHKIGALVE